MNNHRQKAVVIGGSLTGCLVAQVLSSHFNEVVILEKDQFDCTPTPRKGVPQENHLHIVLKQGMDSIEAIFPGISDSLSAQGGVTVNLGHGLRWYQAGQWKAPYTSKLSSVLFSRALLDTTIRQRILNNPSIQVKRRVRVNAFIIEGSRVEGVRFNDQGADQSLHCDLVVDCSGAGSKTAEWLNTAGFDRVENSTLKKQIRYSSALYRSESPLEKKAIVIWDTGSHKHNVGLLFPIEKDTWIVSTGGCFDSNPTADKNTFKAFIDALPQADISQFISQSTAVSDLHTFAFPGSAWLHYEKMPNFPLGLIVAGAAFCRLNPFFGQGITLCASHALVISQYLLRNTEGCIATRDVQQQLAKANRSPWKVSEVEDLRHACVPGKRSLLNKFLMWYTQKFYCLSNHDVFARELQFKVMHQIASPYALFHPFIVFKVLAQAG
ncbi:hypothetical protein AQS70_16005 [Pseudomonas endophytica]|uniref:FAD-binding domain-containing protein n=1 Tax=Pseudomonas endophytica TaxID=1563157 RepID=A0A0N8VS09_9PSED|nr:FAD-dependent monooxygenase [Pseudomonas endophytica]KQB52012.1 hypothetical protein AQS70_16005 [Pseudomonas endophytica]